MFRQYEIVTMIFLLSGRVPAIGVVLPKSVHVVSSTNSGKRTRATNIPTFRNPILRLSIWFEKIEIVP